jgi:hypothetical protein
MKKTKDKKSVANRAGKALAWGAAKRLLKRAPVVGTVVTIGLAGYDIKRKGVVKGSLNVALDATPILGTVKGVVEIFTGDLLSDKETAPKRKHQK